MRVCIRHVYNICKIDSEYFLKYTITHNMDTLNLDIISLRLEMNSIQTSIIKFELNEIRDKLMAVEDLVRNLEPDEEFIPRKKRRVR